MRLVSMLVALAVVLALVFFYMKSAQRDVDKITGGDTTSATGSMGYTDYARDAVDQVNKVQEETQKQLDALGK